MKKQCFLAAWAHSLNTHAAYMVMVAIPGNTPRPRQNCFLQFHPFCLLTNGPALFFIFFLAMSKILIFFMLAIRLISCNGLCHTMSLP